MVQAGHQRKELKRARAIKGTENWIGGSSPVVDFLGAGAGFASDSRRAEGPTAGPNTEFLGWEVVISERKKVKAKEIQPIHVQRIEDCQGGSG